MAIVGAGKTAMDTAVWLLSMGLGAERISWVMPRDSWLLNRRVTQPGLAFFEDAIGAQAEQIEAGARARDVPDLFAQLEAAGVMLRLSRAVEPTMFHYATISQREVQLLQTIGDVIRLGRVVRIDANGLVLTSGQRAMPAGTLYVDCTASALASQPPVPTFSPRRITPQLVRVPQPTFSAAFTAHVESLDLPDAEKNLLCQPVPFPDSPQDWPSALLGNMRNEAAWSRHPGLRSWIAASRLDGFRKLVEGIAPDDDPRRALLARMRAAGPAAMANLTRLAAAP